MDEDLTRSPLRRRFELLKPVLDERLRRLWAAAEAISLGAGGVSLLSGATGLSRTTIRAGIEELRSADGESLPRAMEGRVRRPGAGRKAACERDSTLEADLEALLESSQEAGTCPVDWTCKSIRALAADLAAEGHQVSYRTVGNLLHRRGFRFSLAESYKRFSPAIRREQFRRLSRRASRFLERHEPVVSLALADVATQQLVSPEAETAGLAAAVLRYWWKETGAGRFPRCQNLLLLLDSSGLPTGDAAIWVPRLRELAEDSRLTIVAEHFPPGARHWRRSARELTFTGSRLGTEHSLAIELDLVLPPDPAVLPPARASPGGGEAFDDEWCYRIVPGAERRP